MREEDESSSTEYVTPGSSWLTAVMPGDRAGHAGRRPKQPGVEAEREAGEHHNRQGERELRAEDAARGSAWSTSAPVIPASGGQRMPPAHHEAQHHGQGGHRRDEALVGRQAPRERGARPRGAGGQAGGDRGGQRRGKVTGAP